MSDEHFLELRNTSVAFKSGSRRIHALDGVDMKIDSKERIAIVGESGAGKTTLARCLLGLSTPISGNVLFKGKDINSRNKKFMKEFRKCVQVIFQDPYGAMNPKQNIFDYLSMPLKFLMGRITKPEMTLKSIELLSAVGLEEDTLWKFPHQLSGGQKQRIAIARALASDPEFIIADEPTSMLDASAAAGILNLLKKLADSKGMGYAIVTHNMGVAAYSTQKTYVMYSGKIVEQRETRALIASPRHPYSKVLLDHAPRSLSASFLQNGDSRAENESESDPWAEKGCRYRPLCSKAVKQCGLESPPLNPDGSDGRLACFNP